MASKKVVREIKGLGNHATKKSQKSVGLPRKGEGKSKPVPVKTSKKLYIYRSKDDKTLTVWHGKFSSKLMLNYWALAYEVSIKRVGGGPGDIVRRIAAGIEFGNETVRFDPL